MKLVCLRPYTYMDSQRFEPGEVYDLPDQLAQAMLRDMGPVDSDASRRGQPPTFEPFVEPTEAEVDEKLLELSEPFSPRVGQPAQPSVPPPNPPVLTPLDGGAADQQTSGQPTPEPTETPGKPDTSAKDALKTEQAQRQAPKGSAESKPKAPAKPRARSTRKKD